MRTALFLVVSLAAAPAVAQGHPAARYSCMSPVPPGEPTPWVDAGVPSSIEILHPGYAIRLFHGFEVAGLQLFQIVGGRRADGVDERYTHIEAVDEAGRVLGDRALFVLASERVTSAHELARRALAILVRRADQRPLVPGHLEALSERVRDRITAPTVSDGVLTFWVRDRSDLPYASEVTVELATGIVSGAPY